MLYEPAVRADSTVGYPSAHLFWDCCVRACDEGDGLLTRDRPRVCRASLIATAHAFPLRLGPPVHSVRPRIHERRVRQAGYASEGEVVRTGGHGAGGCVAGQMFLRVLKLCHGWLFPRRAGGDWW